MLKKPYGNSFSEEKSLFFVKYSFTHINLVPNNSFRGILPSAKDLSSNPLASTYARLNPTFELLFKEQEQLLKHANVYKNIARFPMNAQERLRSFSRQQSPQIEITLSKGNLLASTKSPSSPSIKKAENTVQNLSLSLNEEDLPDDEDDITVVCAKANYNLWNNIFNTLFLKYFLLLIQVRSSAASALDEILGKHSGSYLKDSFRFSCNETTSSVSLNLKKKNIFLFSLENLRFRIARRLKKKQNVLCAMQTFHQFGYLSNMQHYSMQILVQWMKNHSFVNSAVNRIDIVLHM